MLFELLTEFGWASVKGSERRERPSNPILVATGYLLAGVAAGVLSVILVPWRLAPRSPLPGASLVLSPLGTGMVMQWLGELWRDRGRSRPALFSFRAGAIFAFGMAIVRFLVVELSWRPF